VPFSSVRVLGIEVHCVVEQDVVDFVRERLRRSEPTQIVTVNAEFVMIARRDSRFRAVLAGADVATPDGAGIVWAAQREGATITRRVGGSDLIWSVSRQAAVTGDPVFLLGAAEGVAALAARRLQDEIPGLQVAGSYAGSPAVGQEDSIVDLVRTSGARILFVAFGAPQQDLRLSGWNGSPSARMDARTRTRLALAIDSTTLALAANARLAPLRLVGRAREAIGPGIWERTVAEWR
jgi:N-acetylglucosaminyldiphosphoundecaprenol N-acetyl-beta-D-mannosaminyltransferase